MLIFELPGLPKTVNAIGRKHWRIVSAERKKWKLLVWHAVRNAVPDTPFKKARLVLTRFSSVEPDFDGNVSSWKSVIDGLVMAKIIDDDKMSVIGMPDFRWEKVKRGEGKIRIEVYPC